MARAHILPKGEEGMQLHTYTRTYVRTYSRPITKYSILPLRLNFDEYSGLYGSCMPSSPLGSICALEYGYNGARDNKQNGVKYNCISRIGRCLHRNKATIIMTTALR